MMVKYAALLLVAIGFTGLVSFTTAKESVNWISFADLEKQYAIEPRPVIIDVYTTWCGWCRHMDKTTYSQKDVVTYINTKYYAVKFDAEGRQPIHFKGRKFVYNPQYRVHELAIYLTNRNLNFPHTIFLSDLKAPPAPLSGYLKPAEIEKPLKFFGDSAYLTMNYPEFERTIGKSTGWK